jgi:hypothetical protein
MRLQQPAAAAGALVACALLGLLLAWPAAAAVEVTLLHYNDVHHRQGRAGATTAAQGGPVPKRPVQPARGGGLAGAGERASLGGVRTRRVEPNNDYTHAICKRADDDAGHCSGARCGSVAGLPPAAAPYLPPPPPWAGAAGCAVQCTTGWPPPAAWPLPQAACRA